MKDGFVGVAGDLTEDDAEAAAVVGETGLSGCVSTIDEAKDETSVALAFEDVTGALAVTCS